MPESYTAEQVRELRDKLLARPIAFHRAFAEIAGSVAGGVMLSQLYYWSQRTTDPKGWIYKTGEEWTEETTLSRKEQESVRKRLLGLKILEEHLHGIPATMHYRLNRDALDAALMGYSRSLSPAQIIDIYAGELADLSKLARARAIKGGRDDAELVDFATVLVRDAAICYLCHKQITKGPGRQGDALHFDHVTALSDGGAHTAENIRAVHADCNQKKKAANPVCSAGTNSVCSTGTNLPALPEADRLAPAEQTNSETTQRPTDISIPPEKLSLVEKPLPSLALTPPESENVLQLKPDDPDLEKLYTIKKTVEFMWDFEAVPFDWGEADTKAAKAIIAELRTWDPDQFAFAVVCRFRSININSALAPRHWLKQLQKYGAGPLDEYDHDKLLNPQERQKYREKISAMLGDRKPAGEQIVLPIDSTA